MSSEKPRLPVPTSTSRRRSSSEQNTATYAALVGLLLLAFGFLGLASMVLPQVRGVVVVLFGGVAFFSIHYLVWGRLLSRIRNKEREAQQDRARYNRTDEP